MPQKKRPLIRRIGGRAKRMIFGAPSDGFPIDAWTQPCYHDWFLAHRATEQELAAQRATELGIRPMFSIIVPLYKTPISYLQMMVDSVIAQTYGCFELILVNASPENAKLAKAVQDYCESDSRIRQIKLKGNLGITENTNYGIDAAKGDFMCFLDHDDFLEPNLLFEYASAIDANPDTDVLYCDEDLVEVRGTEVQHVHPLFKPHYAPELLLCKNYIVHLMCVRASIVREMPRPTSQYDGAQDYNMVLYATRAARRVANIEKVLYHWRMSDVPTAAKPNAKPYSQRAYRLSASKRIQQQMPGGRIVWTGIINIHNVWLPSFADGQEPRVSIIVDCASDLSTIQGFAEMLSQTNTYPNVEVVAVSTESEGSFPTEGLADRVVRASKGAKGTFARLNEGARAATGSILIFMDSKSIFLTPESVEQLARLATSEGIGVAAPKTLYIDNSVKGFGIAITKERIMPLYRGYPDDFPAYQCNTRAFQDASAAGWQGMAVTRAGYQAAGGFDMNFEGEIGSADFCQRVCGGQKRTMVTPTVKVQTCESAPQRRYDIQRNSPDFTPRDDRLFRGIWKDLLPDGDPYLNSNLNQSSNYFQVVDPNPKR